MVRFRMGAAHKTPGKPFDHPSTAGPTPAGEGAADGEGGAVTEMCWGEVLHSKCGPIVLWKVSGEATKAVESVPLPSLVSVEGDDAPDEAPVAVSLTLSPT